MSHSFTPDTHATVTTSCGLTVTVCCPHECPVVLPPLDPAPPATLSAASGPDFVSAAPAVEPKAGKLDKVLAIAETLIALLKQFAK